MASLGAFNVAVRDAEGAEPDTFEFCGETFTVGKPGLIPLGEFAEAAMSGLDTADMQGLAAMNRMLADVVIDADRGRFLETARRNRADAEDLMPIIQAVIEAAAARPTQRPSDSSPGPSSTGTSSKGSSSSEASSDPRRAGLQPVEAAALSLVG